MFNPELSDSHTHTENPQEFWVKRIRQIVIQEYPFLEKVYFDVNFFEPYNVGAEMGGAYFYSDENSDSEIKINLGDQSHVEELRKSYETTLDIFAEMCGIKPEQMTAELMGAIIMLHEYGHAHDFEINYLQDEYIGELDPETIAEMWKQDRAEDLNQLPVPHVTRMQLKNIFKATPFKKWLEEKPDIKIRLDSLGLYTEDAVMHAQQAAYRSARGEKYADDFAINFIKKHLPEIIQDIER